jgi:hypothetical protein
MLMSLLRISILCLFMFWVICNECLASTIGNVVEQEGNTVVDREGSESNLMIDSDIMFMDTVKTGKGNIGITFKDDTNIAVSPQSSLVIDDFIYDPNDQGGSKLAMKIISGTVRYASGNIAKLNRQNVDIRTPTAKIVVRGTAFSMTVDEIGKSLIILLPNADGTVGEISVETAMGQVILTQAFQATTVGTIGSTPSAPVLLDLSLNEINNMLIIKPPKEKLIEIVKDLKQKTGNLLDIDLLEFDELDENELDKDNLDFGILDVNPLDIDLLLNMLTEANKQYEITKKSIRKRINSGVHIDGQTAGYNPSTFVTTLIEGDDVIILRDFDGSHTSIKVDRSAGQKINIEQNGSVSPEIFTDESGYSTTINITIQ